MDIMIHLQKMMKSFVKSLSSNKVLKCVLLNTAVELFGCMNFVSPNQSYYWDLGNANHLYNTDAPSPYIDHMYSTLLDAPSPFTEVPNNTLPQRITEQSTTRLPTIEEHLPFPAADGSNESPHHKFYFLIPADVLTQAITMLNETELENNSVAFSDCAVQTDDFENAHKITKSAEYCNEEISFYDILNSIQEIEKTPSILWDSYDLHDTKDEMRCYVHGNKLSTSNEVCSSDDDLMLMDLSKSLENEVEPVSSTPWLNRKISWT